MLLFCDFIVKNAKYIVSLIIIAVKDKIIRFMVFGGKTHILTEQI